MNLICLCLRNDAKNQYSLDTTETAQHFLFSIQKIVNFSNTDRLDSLTTYLSNGDNDDLPQRDPTKNLKSEELSNKQPSVGNKPIQRRIAIPEDTQNRNGTSLATWTTMKQKPKMKTTKH